MISNDEKWEIMRNLVKSKILELRFISSRLLGNANTTPRLLLGAVRKKFLPAMYVSKIISKNPYLNEKKWIDCMSSVDLLYLFNFYNTILEKAFTTFRITRDERPEEKKDGFLYNKVSLNVGMRGFTLESMLNIIDLTPIDIKIDGKRYERLCDFNRKPKDIGTLKYYSADEYAETLADVEMDAYKAYLKDTDQPFKEVNNDYVKSLFKVNSRYFNGFIANELEVRREETPNYEKFIGFDSKGNSIMEINGVYYHSNGVISLSIDEANTDFYDTLDDKENVEEEINENPQPQKLIKQILHQPYKIVDDKGLEQITL